jgi:hypothetical protein
LLGRIVLDPGSHRLGQTIVVENKANAAGTIGSFDALIKREIASNLVVSLDYSDSACAHVSRLSL